MAEDSDCCAEAVPHPSNAITIKLKILIFFINNNSLTCFTRAKVFNIYFNTITEKLNCFFILAMMILDFWGLRIPFFICMDETFESRSGSFGICSGFVRDARQSRFFLQCKVSTFRFGSNTFLYDTCDWMTTWILIYITLNNCWSIVLRSVKIVSFSFDQKISIFCCLVR